MAYIFENSENPIRITIYNKNNRCFEKQKFEKQKGQT